MAHHFDIMTTYTQISHGQVALHTRPLPTHESMILGSFMYQLQEGGEREGIVLTS